MKTFRLLNAAAIAAITLAAASCGGNDDNSKDEPVPDTPSYAIGTRVNVEVLGYDPAPGQFINQIPEYEDGDTRQDIINKATNSLNNGDMVSLGAWGGSIVLKLSSPIKNVSGKPDFRVVGNAVYAGTLSSGVHYGTAEPGIVLVMQDTNKNGIADDTWYELKGDQTLNGIEDFTVTYYRPGADATDAEYIRWEASNGDTGYLNRNSGYHEQDFFPMWLGAISEMTFSGRRLPDNGAYNPATGKFDLSSFNGYADSHPNNSDESCLDIDNAIDADGNKAALQSIDFIKIYTGVLQANGPVGECSVEVAAIEKVNQ